MTRLDKILLTLIMVANCFVAFSSVKLVISWLL